MSTRRLRVLHVTPSFHPAVRYGGPTASVLNLCRALQGEGVEVEVVTTTCDGPDELDVPVDREVAVFGLPVRYYRPTLRYPRDFSATLAARVLATAGDYDILHALGLFDFTTGVVALAARRAGRPFLVTPCGAFNSVGDSSEWRKRGYLALLDRLGVGVGRAAALHAASALEHAGIRAILPTMKVFDVPCGVTLPDAVPDVRREPHRVVFLGRLDEIKGFDVLIPALSRVAAVMPDVETVFAGYDAGGQWDAITRLQQAQHPVPRLRYIGAVEGDEKLRFLASASVLALVSRSESFGLVVVEALACGTPVVVSRSCPWQSVEELGAGFWVERTPERVAAALLSLLGDPALVARMGAAGKELAKRYPWSSAGRAMAAQYAAILADLPASQRRPA
jgi:glycosyltransferase involved in cell wall biosynthesis